MITAMITTLSVAACAVILWRAEPALNRMTAATPFIVRTAFWLLVIGAVAQLMAITSGIAPHWSTVLLQLGVAALLYCERRLRVLIPRTPHKAAAPDVQS